MGSLFTDTGMDPLILFYALFNGLLQGAILGGIGLVIWKKA